MKITAIALSVVLLTGASSVWAQEAKTKTSSPIQQLIEQLGDTEYRVRKEAEKALLARGAEASKALQETARSHEDPEVKWRAGRILEKIRSGLPAESKGLTKRGDTRVEKVEENPERGDASPRRSPRSPWGLLEDLESQFGPGGIDPDLQRMFEQLRNRIEKMETQVPGGGLSRSGTTGRSVRIQQGPDGVEVEVTETGKDGKPVTRSYKAESMEAFREKFPDVLGDEIRIDGFRPFRGFGLDRNPFPMFRTGLRSRMPRVPPRAPSTEERGLRKRNDASAPVEQGGPKLGVYVAELDAAVRDYLELDNGLIVQEVLPDSLADKLGVERKDVLLRVGDREVSSVADVAAGLARAKTPDGVRVEVLRRGRRVTLGGGKSTGAKDGALKKKTPK